MAKLFRSHSPASSLDIPAKESLPAPYLENGSPENASNFSVLYSMPAENDTLSPKDLVKSAFCIMFENAYPPGLKLLGLQPLSSK